jgi:uncharacterized damage-inducible protein DinB
MLQKVLVQLYERDLGKLRDELELYADEADLWKTGGDIKNSAGNLALHLVGNLEHFIGAVLGGSGYVRNRDAEFADKGVSRREIIEEIDRAIPIISRTLTDLSDDDLAATYPIDVFGHPMTTEYFLTHLTTHFSYHLGQLNYHRRLLTK